MRERVIGDITGTEIVESGTHSMSVRNKMNPERKTAGTMTVLKPHNLSGTPDFSARETERWSFLK